MQPVSSQRFEEPPLTGPIEAYSRSAHELRDAVSVLTVPHEVEPLRGELDGQMTGANVGDVQLAFVRYGEPARVVAPGTGSRVAWTIPLGPMGVAVGSASRDVLAEGFLLSQTVRTTMFPDERQGAVVLATSLDRLSRHYGRLTGGVGGEDLRFDCGRGSGRVRGLLESTWRHTAAVLQGQPEPPRVLATVLEEALLTAILLEVPHNASERLLNDDHDSRAGDVHARRAREWAEDRLGRPITMTEWAAAVGLSVRHLQKVFRDTYGCSPGGYLRERRLQWAHTLLSGATDPDLTVTRVAERVGLPHLGRFAAAYRRRFAEAPSEALYGSGVRPPSTAQLGRRAGSGPDALRS
ncbi:MAG: AraC family transcriptional regulator [Nocardioidaceae bacterium]